MPLEVKQHSGGIFYFRVSIAVYSSTKEHLHHKYHYRLSVFKYNAVDHCYLILFFIVFKLHPILSKICFLFTHVSSFIHILLTSDNNNECLLFKQPLFVSQNTTFYKKTGRFPIPVRCTACHWRSNRKGVQG